MSLVDPSVWTGREQGHPMSLNCIFHHPVKEQLGALGFFRGRRTVCLLQGRLQGNKSKGCCSIPLRATLRHIQTDRHTDTNHSHSPSVTYEAVFHEEAKGPIGWADLFSCHERHPSQLPTGYRLPSVRGEDVMEDKRGTVLFLPSLAHHQAAALTHTCQSELTLKSVKCDHAQINGQV